MRAQRAVGSYGKANDLSEFGSNTTCCSKRRDESLEKTQIERTNVPKHRTRQCNQEFSVWSQLPGINDREHQMTTKTTKESLASRFQRALAIVSLSLLTEAKGRKDTNHQHNEIGGRVNAASSRSDTCGFPM